MKRSFEELLTLKEAAGLFGIHPGTLQRWVAQGKVPALKIKRHWPKRRPRRT
jgi:excisionase family DNA binding protein